MKYWKYFSYLARHKWFVFLACLRYGLIWQGIIHDYSKFFLDELIPYANFFYGGDKRKDRFYDPKQGTDEFNVAWLKHQHRNPHHWQHWILQEDDGNLFPIRMPERYAKEMLCDWIGAGAAQGHHDTLSWYETNQHKMTIHPDTRIWIEKELGYNASSDS